MTSLQRTVLIVDDEDVCLRSFQRMLDGTEFEVCCVESGRGAERAAATTIFDVAVVDYRLQHNQDGLVLARCLQQQHGMPFVLISGFLNTELTVRAMREGASDVLDKPVDEGRLRASVRAAIQTRRATVESVREVGAKSEQWACESTAHRLGRLLLSACQARDDPRTISALARETGVSGSVFRALCRLCGVRALDARDFVRFLRAISLAQTSRSPIGVHLSIADERTACRLFDRAGLALKCREVTLREFVRTQRFIGQNCECLHEVCHMAANAPRLFK